ncbi:TPA: hypothetical protein NNQ05_004574, partial [Salmonella enterica]|nr:hypothetical protein [Salmonella enterica]
MAKLTKSQIALLGTIAAATADNSFVYASGKDQKALVDAGFAEINATLVNDKQETATRATQAGFDFVKENESKGTSPVTQSTAQTFAIATGVEIPVTPRTRESSSIYPFEQLEIGQSFFVPVSEDKPNPAKSLASTVTSANDRHAYEIEGETMVNRKGETVPKKGFNKRFIVRPVEDGAAWGFAGQA